MSMVKPNRLSTTILGKVEVLVAEIGQEAESRAYRASNVLTNATAFVLRGQRSGRRYKIPGTYAQNSFKPSEQKIYGHSIQRLKDGQKRHYYVVKDKEGRVQIKQRRSYHGRCRPAQYYTASAPGESPAVRTGVFRAGWKRRRYVDNQSGQDRTIHAITENGQKVGGYLLGELLEEGAGNMAPRPYQEKVLTMAMPKVFDIYNEPYHQG